MIEQRVVAFNPEFERARAIKLRDDVNERERFNAYAKRQLETHLGERFNVLLSTTRYEIRNNQIFGENMDEPFINVLIKGRNYRRLHGNSIDFEREDAEVFGFAKVESALASQDAQVGEMVISISRPGGKESSVSGVKTADGCTSDNGSIYKHNFYDIFTLRKDEKGEYVEARRYSSGLSPAETTEKLKTAGILPKDANPTVEEFLANPISINPKTSLFDTADRIHVYLHKEHQYLSKDIYNKALGIVQSLISRYANSVETDPLNIRAQNLYLNATLNGFDMAVEAVSEQNSSSVDAMRAYALETMFSSRSSVDMLGNKSVRVVATGCGPSGGFSANDMSSPFSVFEFTGENAKKDPSLCKCKGLEPHFHCPGTKNKSCGHPIIVGEGTAACPDCGAGKKC